MNTSVSTLTILFEAPFWIGLYERECGGRYDACKITFGAEPKDYEVYDFLLKNWSSLKFSPSVEVEAAADKRVNPKRMRRLIAKQIDNMGIGTKAQQALKLQQEQGKTEHKSRSREQREEEKQRQFELREEKRKEKHKGH
ncbi:YjdF family protein [Caproiciproducens faecalis]|uniref:YjdF family protein n=1 Tax=Caproiciproducens faecalis TaxID=2820301 RepID=A0ABS7DKS8_9FIRM|nr:YjdF family protein [Caproiciproducens faecalis]MBW7571900.1 YjdF family protein [Caproiciproducens faecalis]